MRIAEANDTTYRFGSGPIPLGDEPTPEAALALMVSDERPEPARRVGREDWPAHAVIDCPFCNMASAVAVALDGRLLRPWCDCDPERVREAAVDRVLGRGDWWEGKPWRPRPVPISNPAPISDHDEEWDAVNEALDEDRSRALPDEPVLVAAPDPDEPDDLDGWDEDPAPAVAVEDDPEPAARLGLSLLPPVEDPAPEPTVDPVRPPIRSRAARRPTKAAPKGETMVTNDLIFDPALSGDELKVLLALLAHRNRKTGQCNPRQARLAAELGIDVRRVRERIERLADMGYIEIRPEGRLNHYRIVLDPDERPALVKQRAEAKTARKETRDAGKRRADASIDGRNSGGRTPVSDTEQRRQDAAIEDGYRRQDASVKRRQDAYELRRQDASTKNQTKENQQKLNQNVAAAAVSDAHAGASEKPAGSHDEEKDGCAQRPPGNGALNRNGSVSTPSWFHEMTGTGRTTRNPTPLPPAPAEPPASPAEPAASPAEPAASLDDALGPTEALVARGSGWPYEREEDER